jgi:hypothetical protein
MVSRRGVVQPCARTMRGSVATVGAVVKTSSVVWCLLGIPLGPGYPVKV